MMDKSNFQACFLLSLLFFYNTSLFGKSSIKINSEFRTYFQTDTCPTGKEMNIWLIGDKHGIDWSNGTPNITGGLNADIYEGHTSYCKPDGSLAIYTEGHHVYNGQGNSIRFTAAELLSNTSTTMSLILAKPGQDSLFYVFHMYAADQYFNLNDAGKLYYSVYNVNTEKMEGRAAILDTTSEKITAVRHCNGKDWWVIGMKGTGNAFYAWLLTDSGLNPNPVISKSGFEHQFNSVSNPFWANVGYLKPSHDGRLLTEITSSRPYQPQFIEIHNFDPATGQVSFLTQITVVLPDGKLTSTVYSCEYSPDNRYLYVLTNSLWQFDLSVIDSVSMMNSLKVFDFSSFKLGNQGSPVLGPDGRMYMTSFWQNYIHLIPEPNKPYPDCGFIPRYINVGSQTGLAAPQYPSGLMWPYKAYMRGPNSICRSDTSKWYLTDPCPHEKLVWTLPDGGNILENGDTLKANFEHEGIYRIIVSYEIPCGYKSDTMHVNVGRCHCPSDFRWLQIDTLVCKGESATLIYDSGSWISSSGANDSTILLSSVIRDTILKMNFFGPENCDTSVQVSIKVLPIKETRQEISICYGDSIYVNGIWYKNDIVLQSNELGQNGCDSIHTISIKVYSESKGRKLWPVCPGDSMYLQGRLYFNDTILYSQHIDRYGCDSLHIDEIKVGGTDTVQFSHKLCRGDSLFINGQVYKDSGRLERRLISSRGCEDSLVIHQILIVEPTAKIQEQIKLCAGDSVRIAGKWYKNDTVFQISYLNAQGCDSLREWNIILIPTIPIRHDTLYFCNGDSILIEGQYHIASKKIDLYYNSYKGCDSTVVLSLIQYPADPPSLDQHLICYGDSILIAGNYISKDTIFEKNYNDQYGCDSTIQHWIILLPEIPVVEISNSICPGDSIFIDGSFYYDSIVLRKHFSSQITGCDSVVNYRISLLTAPEPFYTKIISCPGDTIRLDGKEYIFDASLSLRRSSPSGCDSLFHYEIRFLPEQDAGLPDVLELEEGQSIVLKPWIASNIRSIRWYPTQGLSCSSCGEPTLTVSSESVYYLETIDDAGCVHIDSVVILLRKIESQIHIPNAFSPNGDGVNDYWIPIGSHSSVQFHNIEVYDRWGGQIFNWSPNIKDELPIGWDGKFKDHPMTPGVYVYRISYSSFSNPIVEISGEMTLIR
ncbi:MAG: gliding motility-associated C-terminal domain-containing protein [Saprospiraceae bacterium]|nr:gliding motility-associated C-terminal domain-containing protein [Candidatus Vicinibacter affinis]